MQNRRGSRSETGAPVGVVHAGRLHLAQQVVLGVARPGLRAAVQDQRLARIPSQLQVAPQVQQLGVAGEKPRS